MNHHTTADFWDCYNKLPEAVRKLADANYELRGVRPYRRQYLSDEPCY